LADLLAASPGGAGRNRTLGIKALESIQVPVPCIDKQRWFHSLQTKVQEMRALRAKAGEELEALLPSLLDRAFAGEL
jgi:type I restriction enzyme S subunit